MHTFQGYYRPGRRAGIRNEVIVISTVACANGVVDRIAKAVSGTIPIKHSSGCGGHIHFGEYFEDTIVGVCTNPNVFAVILIGLGCEPYKARNLERKIRDRGVNVFCKVIQEDGGSEVVITDSIVAARKYIRLARSQERTPIPMKQLAIGAVWDKQRSYTMLSHAFSVFTQSLISTGASIVLGGISDYLILDKINTTDPGTGDRIRICINEITQDMQRYYTDRDQSPIDFRAGGIVLEECAISGFVDYAAPVNGMNGVILQNNNAYPPEAITGLFASGTQICIFVSDSPVLMSNPTGPVVSFCHGPDKSNDVDASEIEEKEKFSVTMETVLMSVVDGAQCKMEKMGLYGPLIYYRKTPKDQKEEFFCTNEFYL